MYGFYFKVIKIFDRNGFIMLNDKNFLIIKGIKIRYVYILKFLIGRNVNDYLVKWVFNGRFGYWNK